MFVHIALFKWKKGVKEEESEPQSPKKIERPILKPRSFMPGFLAITVELFLLLVIIAVGNIKLSETKSFQLASTVTVPAVRPIVSPEVKSEATSAAMPKSHTVVVKIDDGEASSSANIRQKPTTSSEKIGKAKNGDTFEFVSLDSDWYEVKLADGSTGFISAEYIKEGEVNN